MYLYYMSGILKNTNITRIGVALRRWTSGGVVKIRKIDKLLIANRGEIACRVMRTAQRLGVRTVAVYSEADEHALHVAMADEAYKIGPPPAIHSYLRGDKLLEIAQKSGCQAIHPGYGFLSENVEFAENCQENGIIFVGPPASAIRDMGIKSKSKEIMSNAGVPIIEGYHGDDQSVEKLKHEAKRIGFPIMIKAVRGGGGKGMRIAMQEGEFEAALASAKSEAEKSFGDSVVLLEKFVGEPRHVEVQIFADMHGNAVHLFERDCSVQRRHQKIIEEAPAPGLREEVRRELGAAAVRAAKAVGYVGAGTVEFILDRRTHSFHFMEMNTRLQVEHPITEMITGTDLVEWQLKIANGETLPLTQDKIKLNGHAFEARIYAEDPNGGFLPGAGTLVHLSTPPLQDNMRIETGVREGDDVSVHYDPMIAKLVVWHKTRKEALEKLQSLLLEYNIAGLETNVNFLLDLSKHPEFVAENVHTNFIQDNEKSLFAPRHPSEHQTIQAILAILLNDELTDMSRAAQRNDSYNPFVVESGFRPNYQLARQIKLHRKDNPTLLAQVKYAGPQTFHISTDSGRTWSTASGQLTRDNENNKLSLKSTVNDVQSYANIFCNDDVIVIFDQCGKTEFALEVCKFDDEDEAAAGSSGDRAVAPMPGVLDKILVNVGDGVKKGDPLFVLVAMKMEHVVKAGRDGIVASVNHPAGSSVQKDAVVVQFQEECADREKSRVEN